MTTALNGQAPRGSRQQLSSLCEGARQQEDEKLAALCHAHCHGNAQVRTSFGDVALTLRCDCCCHQEQVGSRPNERH
jgi:hypothetical protein